MAYRTPVYNVSVKFSCDGAEDVDASSFDVEWGINRIPEATVLLPLNKFDSKSNVYVVQYGDPSLGGKNPILGSLLAAKESGTDCSLSIDISKISGTGEPGASLHLSGWKVSNIVLQPQNNASPGGISVTISHPMSKLTASQGYFNPGTADFKKDFEEGVKAAGNVIEVGDAVLNAVEAALNKGETENLGTGADTGVEAAGVRLGEYFEIGECTSFPYKSIFSSQYTETACKIAVGEFFLNVTGSVTPYHAFMSFLAQHAAYFKIKPTDSVAELKKVNPWIRDSVGSFKSDCIYEVAMLPDMFPVCGIRVHRSSVSDNVVCSNYTSTKPFGGESKQVSGDIMYFHQARGNVYNVGVPPTAARIASLVAQYEKSGKNKGYSNTVSDNRIVHTDRFDVSGLKSRSSSGSSEVTFMLPDAYKMFAEAQFLLKHKQSARVAVTLAAVQPSSEWPDIGSFMTVDVGTGGSSVTGMVSGMQFCGSSGAGNGCLVRCTMIYAGDASSFKEIPQNRLWD